MQICSYVCDSKTDYIRSLYLWQIRFRYVKKFMSGNATLVSNIITAVLEDLSFRKSCVFYLDQLFESSQLR